MIKNLMSSRNVLRAELHVHSSISDGRDNVKTILNAAVSKKVDVVSITDHDTVQGSLEAIEVTEEEHLPLRVIPGCEITTSSGHLLAYGITEDVEPKMSMKETCERVRTLGGVCFLAHPFDFIRGGSLRIADFKVVDGVEVFNSKSCFNFLAKRYAKKFSKPGIAGSDAHSANSIGMAITLLPETHDVLSSLLTASYNGRRASLKERLAFLLFQLNQRL